LLLKEKSGSIWLPQGTTGCFGRQDKPLPLISNRSDRYRLRVIMPWLHRPPLRPLCNDRPFLPVCCTNTSPRQASGQGENLDSGCASRPQYSAAFVNRTAGGEDKVSRYYKFSPGFIWYAIGAIILAYLIFGVRASSSTYLVSSEARG